MYCYDLMESLGDQMAAEADGQGHDELLARYPSFQRHVFPGETVVSIEELHQAVPSRPPSALKALLGLMGSDAVRDIGKSGPPHAAGDTSSTDGRRDLGHNHFKKFEAVFGRDSLVVAWVLAEKFPALASTTAKFLAAHQGTAFVRYKEEEPGRIPHEVRSADDPVAREISRTSHWQWPYYGSIDATCLWLKLVAKLVSSGQLLLDARVSDETDSGRTMGDSVLAAYSWLQMRLLQSPVGLLESSPMFYGSLEHQVWKDRWDSYSHEDGSLANVGSVASVEAQGLAYDALLVGSTLIPLARSAQRIGVSDVLDVDFLSKQAANIKLRVLDDFWVEKAEDQFFALAVDRDEHGSLRPLTVRSSNMGHLLTSCLLDEASEEVARKRNLLVRALFDTRQLCAAGVRTLGTNEVRYRPGAYHNGSSWVWDTYWISLGLRRHGFHALADELCRRLLDVYLQSRGFPEFVRGDDVDGAPVVNKFIVQVRDNHGRLNKIEQPPQKVQAWTAASILAVKILNGRRLADKKAHSPAEFEREILEKFA